MRVVCFIPHVICCSTSRQRNSSVASSKGWLNRERNVPGFIARKMGESRLAGARPFVTAGSEEKIKMAVSLGAEGGFNYKKGKFDSWIESVSDGNLFFFVFNCFLPEF